MFREVEAMTSESTPMLGGERASGGLTGFFAKYGRILWWTIVGAAFLLAILVILNVFGLFGSPIVTPPEPRTADVDALFLNTWPIPDVNQRILKQDGYPDLVLKSAVTDEMVAEAYAEADKAQGVRIALEDRMRANGQVTNKHSPSGRHQTFMQGTVESAKISTNGFYMDHASKFVAQKLNLTKEQATKGMRNPKASSNPATPCIPALNVTLCTVLGSAKNTYHSGDGLCNNVNNAGWGAFNQPFRRVIMPDFADGISVPRMASDGGPLPHPRKISTVVHADRKADDARASLLLPIFGQFVDHDIVAIALGVGTSSRTLSCCTADDKVAPILHPECIQFSVNETSEMWNVEGAKCTNQWRSAPWPSCDFGPRNHFSMTTAYIDASVIYGGNDDRIRMYREINIDDPHGYMTTYRLGNGRRLLPVSTDLLDGCNVPEETEKGRMCFTAGDARVNEQMALTSMHLLWVRQHNRIADQLVALFPGGHDGKVYFETREIIIGQLQHVIYNEYLPVLLGKELSDAAGITLQTDGYYEGYDAGADASISNVFASAAYRFGHSLIQGKIKMMDENRNVLEEIPLHQLFYDPFRLWDEGTLDNMLRGLATQPAGQTDNYFTAELTKHLFENKNGSTLGLDLAAINIQRGRDHGIPGYTKWRQACGLPAVANFENLAELWDWNALQLAQGVYSNVDDVDLYTGMLSEKKIPGAMVGPTLGCLLADQFSRLRRGDRFWYEGSIRGRPFTAPQLATIRKITLARIICDNSDGVQYIQLRPLEQISADNPLYSCTSGAIPTLDYSEWEDNVSEGLLDKKN